MGSKRGFPIGIVHDADCRTILVPESLAEDARSQIQLGLFVDVEKLITRTEKVASTVAVTFTRLLAQSQPARFSRNEVLLQFMPKALAQRTHLRFHQAHIPSEILRSTCSILHLVDLTT